MDDQRSGAAFRAIRIRKRWRQVDLSVKSGVSRTIIGRIERGRLATVPLGTIRKVAAALDARFDTAVRWQGGDLGRLVNARHAAMHEAMAVLMAGLDGWVAEPEVSFSIYGERGVIDILAWHPVRRILLVIELKTELVDINDLMGSADRRRRLAASIARDRGWDPVAIGTWVVIAEGRTNRRAVARHEAVLRAKFPAAGQAMRRWLRNPSGRVDALGFLSSVHGVNLGRDTAPIRRVTRPTQRSSRAAQPHRMPPNGGPEDRREPSDQPKARLVDR
ncbi:MAG: helix-turn-helix transcriptional regulator [Chloroflexota bacterium]